MQTAKALPYSFTCIDSGVDWMTATAASGDARRAFQDIWQGIARKETAAGVELQPAAVRDYSGWRLPGAFFGQRHDDSIIVLSGARAPAHWQTVAQAATNVSRLDLQATLWTHGEQPALSRWYYQRVRRLKAQRGRPRSFSLIQTHPHGDTLYVGKRQSDCFGRVYDFAAAHSQGLPRTLWRYEVEYKRHLARTHSARLLNATSTRSECESLVASWYLHRGIQPAWALQESCQSDIALDSSKQRDVLAWFQTSLSKTVASAVRRYGLAAVLDSLGLSDVVMEKPLKEGNAYASYTPSALSGETHRGAARSDDGDSLLDTWRRQFTR